MCKRKTIILSIATNGYDRIFSDILDSQRDYANRNGYVYYVLNHFPCFQLNASMSSWLKIPLILSALTKEYNVAFFDADAKIQASAGSIDDFFSLGTSGCVYMAKDQQCQLGGVNAGVQFVSHGERALAFYKKIMFFATLPNKFLPGKAPEDISLYEQGHVRWAFRNYEISRELDLRWNWTSAKSGDEYVWHAHVPGMWDKKRIHALVSKPSKVKNYFPRTFYLMRAKYYFDKIL